MGSFAEHEIAIHQHERLRRCRRHDATITVQLARRTIESGQKGDWFAAPSGEINAASRFVFRRTDLSDGILHNGNAGAIHRVIESAGSGQDAVAESLAIQADDGEAAI